MQPNELFDAARAVVAQVLDTDFLADGDRAASDLIRAVLQLENAALRSQLDLLHADYAAAIAEVAALTAERDSLRSAPPFALPAPTETVKNARRFRAKQEPANESLTCPECGKTGFKNAAGLGGHRSKTHKVLWPQPAPEPTPTPERRTIRLVDDGPIPFRCEICHSDTFARDLHQIDRCVRCAKRGAA